MSGRPISLALLPVVLLACGERAPTPPSIAGPSAVINTWHWLIEGTQWQQDPDATSGPGDLALVSDLTSGQPGFGVVVRRLALGTKVSDLDGLSYNFFVEAGDCGGGSPRLQLVIDTNGDGDPEGNAFGYGGPTPNFTECASGVWIEENAQDGESQWDLTQFGGAFYNTWDEVVAFFGDGHQVLRVVWVNDSFWTDEPPRMWVDDLNVDGSTLGEPADQRRF